MNAKRPVSTVAACAVMAALAASCSSGQPRSEVQPGKSGVGIVAEGCWLTAQVASGVVLESRGQVVTVAHAIAGATSISVIDDAGAAHPATLRVLDKDRDLAVLAVPSLDAPALSLGSSAPGPGALLAWSRSAGVTYDEVSVTKRLLVTIEDIFVEEIIVRNALEVHGDIDSGDSGGAVLSPTGHVLGIIYAQSRSRDDVGFATDASELKILLRTMPEVPSTTGRCS